MARTLDNANFWGTSIRLRESRKGIMAEDENAPASKKYVWLMCRELEIRIDQSHERMSEQLRDMKTELLKAFLPWREQIRIQF
jgi:hypothetical protein